MKIPLVSAALGMAVSYYLCSLGALPFPAEIPCLVCALVVASAAIALTSVPLRRREGFSPRVLALCAALGLFAGVLVSRHGLIRQDSAYFGFPADKPARFEALVRGDSRFSKNDTLFAPLHITRVWDALGNRAQASADVLAVFGAEAARGKRFFRGETLILKGEFSEGDGGGPFLFVRETLPGGSAPALAAHRKNLLLAIEARITAFQNRPFRSAWPGLFAALLLGNQEYLGTGIADRFREAGAVHVLALSGMHLGLLALLARLCLKPLAPGRVADGIVLALVLAYLWLAGPLPSLLRAAFMFAGYTLLAMFDLRPGPLCLLALSFIVSALFFPQDLQSLSFILSYLAMLGILILTKPINRFCCRWLPHIISLPLSVSLAAQAAVSPVLLAVFGILSPGGIPASLGLGPLLTAFMWTGILACILGALPAPASYPLSWLFSLAMKYLYAAIVFLVELCSRIPPFRL